MNQTSNNGWKRAAAWGEYFQECSQNIDCFNALNASRQDEVLDYSCKKVSVYSDSSVCLCNMRQLKQGVNCSEYTTFTYLGIPVKALIFCFLIYVAIKSVRTTWMYREKHNAVLAALVLASIQVIFLLGWITAMLMRNITTIASVYHAADVLGRVISVPVACVTLMMEHGVIVIAWERSMSAFKRKQGRAKQIQVWVERLVMLYLVVVPLAVMYFNVMNNYNGTSFLTAGSLTVFTASFVFMGYRLHRLLAVTASKMENQSLQQGNATSSTKINAAIQAIRVYTLWIGFASFLAVLSMLFFSISEGIKVTSTEDDIFHPDLIAESFIALSTGNCSRNIVNYILASKTKREKQDNNAVSTLSHTPGTHQVTRQSSFGRSTGRSVAKSIDDAI